MREQGLTLVDAVAGTLGGSTPLSLFHRVNSLVPDRQDLCTISPDTLARDAIHVMAQADYSQLPVISGSEVLGLFSYRSIARRLPTARHDILDHEVEDLADDPVFARVTDELREILPALDHDGAVLVGDPDNLLAVVTPTDVAAYLFRVTQPFMLLQEIELVLRALVLASCVGDSLRERIAAALAGEYEGREHQLPTDLDRLTLNQLVMVVLNRESYNQVFSVLFGRNRDSARNNLGPLGEIRNSVLHFRREASEADLDLLLVARAWLLRKARRLSGTR